MFRLFNCCNSSASQPWRLVVGLNRLTTQSRYCVHGFAARYRRTITRAEQTTCSRETTSMINFYCKFLRFLTSVLQTSFTYHILISLRMNLKINRTAVSYIDWQNQVFKTNLNCSMFSMNIRTLRLRWQTVLDCRRWFHWSKFYV